MSFENHKLMKSTEVCFLNRVLNRVLNFASLSSRVERVTMEQTPLLKDQVIKAQVFYTAAYTDCYVRISFPTVLC